MYIVTELLTIYELNFGNTTKFTDIDSCIEFIRSWKERWKKFDSTKTILSLPANSVPQITDELHDKEMYYEFKLKDPKYIYSGKIFKI